MSDPFKTHGAFSWNELITTDVAGGEEVLWRVAGLDLQGHGHGPGRRLYRGRLRRQGHRGHHGDAAASGGHAASLGRVYHGR